MALENYVKFLRGTPSQYDNLVTKDKDTIYFIAEKDSDFGSLYLGSQLITSAGQPETATLDSLKDVMISNGIEHESLLIYDAVSGAWINKPLDEVLQVVVEVMQGATANQNGKAGLVPIPKAGEQNYFLRGDGSWAEVAATAKTQIFEVTLEKNETHEQGIARVIGSSKLASGDIAIVKEIIANEKYQYTSYVYNNGWKAMDGNYNAENVYFDEDLLTTSAIGVIELVNGQATIPAAGKNLKEIFNTIFVKEQNPIVTNPSVEITISEAGKYEVGKTVSINYATSFNGGSYSFGPEPTGVVVNNYTITDGANVKNSESGSFSNLLVTDNMNYQLTAIVNYSDGKIPVTNTGKEYPEGKINAGSVFGYSNYIKGYRPFFYGVNDTSKENIVYNSDLIRGLNNGGVYDSKKTLTISSNELAKRFIIAIPRDSLNALRTGIASAKITTSLNADVLDFYKELDTMVDVQGADGYAVTVPYKVWVYEPQSIATEEVHEVVLK